MLIKKNKDGKWLCENCFKPIELFMLKNSLWAQITKDKRKLLCIHCCSVKLSRNLTLTDFTDCPANKIYLNMTQKEISYECIIKNRRTNHD